MDRSPHPTRDEGDAAIVDNFPLYPIDILYARVDTTGMDTTTATYRVLIGRGREVHAAESNVWPSRTVCGRWFTDEGEADYDVTCRRCLGRLTGKNGHRRVIEQADAGDRR